ncbi:hypothetical protein [Sphingomonas sp. ID0503]|uniref:hypothetical protein n=1 Tax=Sphingomonas sp. ID0503 TaxID=3399691 RepID=UPI003AFABC9E
MNVMMHEDRVVREARRKAERARRMRFVGWGILIPTLMALFYYAVIAREEYVTRMSFTVQGTKQAPVGDGLAALGIPAASSSGSDGLIVSEFIKSTEMVRRLREDFGLDKAYRGPSVDPVGYLIPRAPTEIATHYWNSHVKATFEPLANVVQVEVSAFTPQDSYRLAQGVMAESEKLVNSLNSKVRAESVKFARRELGQKQREYEAIRQRMTQTRATDQTSLDAEVTQQIEQVGAFDKSIAELKVERAGAQATFVPGSPQVSGLDQRIAALEAQRAQLIARMTRGPGYGEASRAVGTQGLQLDFEFAQKGYYAALEAYQRAQTTMEGERRYIVPFIPPHIPEVSNYWDRFGNVVGVALASALLIGVGALIFSVIKDHLQ